MCNQAVSLMAAAIEARGVSTSAIVLLRFVAEKVRPPRALWVPFKHGYPLGLPDDPELQKKVLRAALSLLTLRVGVPPLLADFTP